jgi:hypothetical protein
LAQSQSAARLQPQLIIIIIITTVITMATITPTIIIITTITPTIIITKRSVFQNCALLWFWKEKRPPNFWWPKFWENYKLTHQGNDVSK